VLLLCYRCVRNWFKNHPKDGLLNKVLYCKTLFNNKGWKEITKDSRRNQKHTTLF